MPNLFFLTKKFWIFFFKEYVRLVVAWAKDEDPFKYRSYHMGMWWKVYWLIVAATVFWLWGIALMWRYVLLA